MQIARPARPLALVACPLVTLGLFLGACGGGEAAPAAQNHATSASPSPAPPAGNATGSKASAAAAGEAGNKPATKGAKGAASAQLAYQTGLQLLLKGDPAKAVAEFRRATELDGQMAVAFFELGKLQVHLSSQNIGSQARDLDVLDKGLAALERACELEPGNDHFWYWAGKARYVRDDHAAARSRLEKAVELNPEHYLAWKMLGRLQKDAAEMEAARASFEKSIAAAPEESGTHFQLGQTLEALEDLPGARAAYERAIELNPTEPDVFGRLSHVCARLGDAACEERARTGMEAWTEYDRKLQRRRHQVNQNPGDAAALLRLGLMYLEVRKWEESIELFLRSIHVEPKNDVAHFYCGVARRHLKDYVNATNHLKEAEFLAPGNLDPKLELLRLYAETEDSAAAKELVSAVETAAAAEGESLWALAEVCQEVGRAEDAARLFDKAKALGVTSAPVAAEAAASAEKD